MNRTVIFAIAAAIVLSAACIGIWYSQNNGPDTDEDDHVDPEVDGMALLMTVDGRKVDVNWEDNPSVDAIKKLAKDGMTVEMQRYGGFEQTGSMAKSIVRNDSSIDVGPGDIVLYNGVQICLYFDDNSYSFTRLGKITGMSVSEIRGMLDKPNVTAVFTLE